MEENQKVKIRVCFGGAWELVKGNLEYGPFNVMKRGLQLPLRLTHSMLMNRVARKCSLDIHSGGFKLSYISNNDLMEIADDDDVEDFIDFVSRSEDFITLYVVDGVFCVGGTSSTGTGSNQQSIVSPSMKNSNHQSTAHGFQTKSEYQPTYHYQTQQLGVQSDGYVQPNFQAEWDKLIASDDDFDDDVVELASKDLGKTEYQPTYHYQTYQADAQEYDELPAFDDDDVDVVKLASKELDVAKTEPSKFLLMPPLLQPQSPINTPPSRLYASSFGDFKRVKRYGVRMELSIAQPDDWHLHLRDGELLEAVVSHSAKQFGRAIVMPNLRPPITTTAAAVSYRESILKALQGTTDFTPLMTLYLTDKTTPHEIKLARESGAVYGVKLYPAGATTNSQDGVTDLFGKCVPALEEMVNQNMPLLVHGEVTDPKIDIFDRERVFIDTVLKPLIQKFPKLKVVMEHVTTMDAIKFVESCEEGSVAATVTPQHLLLNRNSLFQGGLQPHNFCLPVLKRETHRRAIVAAVTSGNRRFFLGTDSAPHERQRKESVCGCAGIFNSPVALSLYAKVFEEAGALDKLEAFTSFNGPDFYGLPRNTRKITLQKKTWKVPESYSYPSGSIVPMSAGESLEWLPQLA